MFETFNIPGLYIKNLCVLSLYAVGKFTGFSIDCRDSVTLFSPKFDGYNISHANNRLNFGGRDITELMI